MEKREPWYVIAQDENGWEVLYGPTMHEEAETWQSACGEERATFVISGSELARNKALIRQWPAPG